MSLSDKSILIKNLPRGIYIPELCIVFQCFGNILSATIQADGCRESTMEALITYEDSFSALKAVKCRNEWIMKNKKLKVVMSSENENFRKVFVKNFNPEWDDCDLFKAFENVGTIEDAKISEDNGKSNGYGYLVFENHYTAKRAVETMNGVVFDGYKLLVERFKSKTERNTLMANSLEYVEEKLRKTAQLNNLHVNNLPTDMTDDELKKLFQKYGEITSAKVMTDEGGMSKGFGFVCFLERENAAKALERMNGFTFRGKKLQVNFKVDGHLRKQYNSLKNKNREVKIKEYKQRSQSVPKLTPHPLNFKIRNF